MPKNRDNQGKLVLPGDSVLLYGRNKGVVSRVAKKKDCFDVWVETENANSCYASENVGLLNTQQSEAM